MKDIAKSDGMMLRSVNNAHSPPTRLHPTVIKCKLGERGVKGTGERKESWSGEKWFGVKSDLNQSPSRHSKCCGGWGAAPPSYKLIEKVRPLLLSLNLQIGFVSLGTVDCEMTSGMGGGCLQQPGLFRESSWRQSLPTHSSHSHWLSLWPQSCFAFNPNSKFLVGSSRDSGLRFGSFPGIGKVWGCDREQGGSFVVRHSFQNSEILCTFPLGCVIFSWCADDEQVFVNKCGMWEQNYQFSMWKVYFKQFFQW